MARQVCAVLYASGRILCMGVLHLTALALQLVGLHLMGLLVVMITTNTVSHLVPLPSWDAVRTWTDAVLSGGKSLPAIWAEGPGMLQQALHLYGMGMVVLGLGLCWGAGLALLVWPFLPQCRVHKE
jgi:hypothetical protein